MKKLLLFFVVVLILIPAIAQQPCITSEVYNQQVKAHPEVLQNQQLFNKQAQFQAKNTLKKSGAVSIVPVVFHIMHNTGSSNISDAQIEDAIRILNEDFRRLNPSAINTRDIFKSVAADVEIEFRLARKDPNGNCTNGIVRVFDEWTNNGNESIKKKSYWPSDKYLNIWVVGNVASFTSGTVGVGIMGYTQYPWVNIPETDGIIIMNRGVGGIGISNANNSKNLTHEAGHWLGCLHTFNDGCIGGDSVADTPPCEKRTSVLGCDTTKNSCANDNPDLPDQIENYMDFTVGTCQNMFTIGQKARMETTLINWRPLISSIQNLIATGTDKVTTVANCAPIARLVALNNQLEELKIACTNTLVSFKDVSYNYSGSVNYEWIFKGGMPATSNLQNPSVSYSQTGSYDVTLIVSNTHGADTLKLKDYITINPTISANFAPFVQDFENFDFATSNWTTNSNHTSKFEITDVGVGTVIPNNSNTVFFKNEKELWGTIANLNSPAYNLSAIAAPVLSFYYAAALRPTGASSFTQDRLKVFYTTNCGQTWTELWSRQGTDLSTLPTSIPGTNQPFFPNEINKWKQVVIPLSPTIPAAENKNVKFRFQFISNGGNNIFIDGINIGFPASTQNIISNTFNFNVYPNPNTGNATVSFTLNKTCSINLTIIDALGREIISIYNNVQLAPQEHSVPFIINKQGIYFIKLSVNGNTYYQKVVIN